MNHPRYGSGVKQDILTAPNYTTYILGIGKDAGVVCMESEILAILNYVFGDVKTLHLD